MEGDLFHFPSKIAINMQQCPITGTALCEVPHTINSHRAFPNVCKMFYPTLNAIPLPM